MPAPPPSRYTPRAWASTTGTRQERGYGAAWQKIRIAALEADQYLCRICRGHNRLTKATQVDHITPKAKGGGDELSNLQAICDDCHSAKTDEDKGRPRPRRVGLDGYPLG